MEKLLDAILVVRAIHAPSHGIAGTFCSHCKTGERQSNTRYAAMVPYPCPTIVAVDEALDGQNPETPEAPSEAGLKRCQSRRYPSGNEKCGLFLIGGLCVHHGRDTGV